MCVIRTLLYLELLKGSEREGAHILETLALNRLQSRLEQRLVSHSTYIECVSSGFVVFCLFVFAREQSASFIHINKDFSIILASLELSDVFAPVSWYKSHALSFTSSIIPYSLCSHHIEMIFSFSFFFFLHF